MSKKAERKVAGRKYIVAYAIVRMESESFCVSSANFLRGFAVDLRHPVEVLLKLSGSV